MQCLHKGNAPAVCYRNDCKLVVHWSSSSSRLVYAILMACKPLYSSMHRKWSTASCMWCNSCWWSCVCCIWCQRQASLWKWEWGGRRWDVGQRTIFSFIRYARCKDFNLSRLLCFGGSCVAWVHTQVWNTGLASVSLTLIPLVMRAS